MNSIFEEINKITYLAGLAGFNPPGDIWEKTWVRMTIPISKAIEIEVQEKIMQDIFPREIISKR